MHRALGLCFLKQLAQGAWFSHLHTHVCDVQVRGDPPPGRDKAVVAVKMIRKPLMACVFWVHGIRPWNARTIAVEIKCLCT